MSTGQKFGDLKTRSVTMDSDLSAKGGYAVTLDATVNDNVNLAAAATAPVFPLIEGFDGSSGKKVGTIAMSGRCIVKLGGIVAPGDKLTSDGSGTWIKTVTNQNHYGAIALQIGASGDEIEVSVERGQVNA